MAVWDSSTLKSPPWGLPIWRTPFIRASHHQLGDAAIGGTFVLAYLGCRASRRTTPEFKPPRPPESRTSRAIFRSSSGRIRMPIISGGVTYLDHEKAPQRSEMPQSQS